MDVTKVACDAYSVRTDAPSREWGTFYLRQWDAVGHDGVRYGGELAAHTSLGNYGHRWSHCGVPFRQFLCELDMSYFMGKAYPGYRVFDLDGSLTAARLAVLETRRCDGIDRQQARSIYDELAGIEANCPADANVLVEALYEVRELAHVTQEPYCFLRERPSAQAEAFWKTLWPLFTQALRAETGREVHA